MTALRNFAVAFAFGTGLGVIYFFGFILIGALLIAGAVIGWFTRPARV